MTDRESLYLRARLDPGAILEAGGITPDDWQRVYVTETAPRVLLVASRQSGKSTATAATAVHQAVFSPGSDVLLIAPALRQAEELFRKVCGLLEALNPPVAIASQTSRSIAFKTGSRVVCVPGSERSLRGFSAPSLVVLDEASRIEDEVFFALSPFFASNPAGRLVAISTPNGTKGWFAAAWLEDPDWLKIAVPATQISRISPAFLERERRLLGERLFRTEYLGEFLPDPSSTRGPIFEVPTDLLEAAFR